MININIDILSISIVPWINRMNYLVKVSDVNWADNNICRSGVVPIHDDGTHRWIGFGISNFCTNITTIGGKHESNDHDLLNTAIREYKEEIGDNLPFLTEEKVYNLYAIKSDYMILILFPITRIPDKFEKTEELSDMLWVTPGQIKQINNNSNFNLSKSLCVTDVNSSSRTPAYVFAVGLKSILENIGAAVETKIPFVSSNFVSFIRPPKIYCDQKQKMVNSLDDFCQDVGSKEKFYGHVALVIYQETVCIMRNDRVVYLFPITSISFVLPKIPCYIITSTKEERDHMIKVIPNKNVRFGSIEYLLDQHSPDIGIEYRDKLATINSCDDSIAHVVNKLNLIFDYEIKCYELSLNNNSKFNGKRSWFLSELSRINRLISQSQNFISKSNRDIVDLMDDMQLIKYDCKSSKYILPK